MFYIGANHLGNIKDIPTRVIDLLQTVDYVLVEFETPFLSDIEKLGIPRPNFLVYEENYNFYESILKLLEDNKSILLLAEHGYPGIADPGHPLIDMVVRSEIPLTIIPGPSIGPVALAVSGFVSVGNIMVETFNKPVKEIGDILSELNQLNYTIVLLDHKENMLPILKLAKEKLPDRQVCLCINLGRDQNQRIIKNSYQNIINYLETHTETEVFGPSENCPVSSIVFGPRQ